ncbi:AAA family ATPase [Actinomadura formosensis]|uniref:AAA family ATPase n=1 Tax=Actinomadura formosensis TaxID=60706 RepID=UPI000A007D1A|nr:DUF3696 domain-containing protein [Actinomadura formosensis]
MALLRMAVENYRSFKERQEIELRPITVILGKNNSGKSALTRLPLILETGIRTDSDLPLDLDALGDDPPEFLDLVYGRNVHRPLGLELTTEFNGQTVDVKATIQNVDEKKTQFVRELEIESEGWRGRFEWEPDEGGNVYNIALGQWLPEIRPVQFKGLIPRSMLRDYFDRELEDVCHFIVRGVGLVRYLGPYRQRPSRLTRLPSRTATEVGSGGENATGMLVNDYVRGDRALINHVNALLGDSLMGWSLEVEPQGPVYAVNLRSSTDPDLMVNLLDSGTGVAQVLPLLVQRAQDMVVEPRRETLQVIEEPELHLHPAFHALLADLFIAAAAQRVRFLIETHSETLLLRLRRRIAEKKITPEDVAVYFVDHQDGASYARRIEIDELGNLDYWPSGVFSEDFEETKSIAEAQFARGRDES